MSKNEDMKPDNDLLAALIDDQLSEEQLNELAELIASGKIDTDDFVDQISLHAALAWHGIAPRPFSAEELLLVESARGAGGHLTHDKDKSLKAQVTKAQLRSWLVPLVAVAAMMFFLIAAPWSAPDPESIAAKAPSEDGVSNSQAEIVATFIDTVGTNMSDWHKSTAQRLLAVDQILEIESGLVELHFHCGADAVLTGPARLHILGHKEVSLDVGKLSVRMHEGVDGFVVKTPDGHIRDLGTAFGVDVSGVGTSHVAVYDGAVDVSPADRSDSRQRVNAGEALKISRDGTIDAASFSGAGDVRDFSLSQPNQIVSASRDAFVRGGNIEGLGESRNYGEETELHVKYDPADVDYNRRAWIGFDLTSVPRSEIIGARLTLDVAPNRLAEIIEPQNKAKNTDWKFEVSGLWDLFHDDWSESKITWRNAPGNAPDTISGQLSGPHAPTALGTFKIRSRGKRGEKVRISGSELLEFIRSDDDGHLTLIVSRRSGLSWGKNHDRVIHGFASKEHPDLDPPTLELWYSQEELAQE